MNEAWPGPLEFQEAVQTAKALGEKTGLRTATLALNRLELPVAYTGKFAVVFKFTAKNGKAWAARFFTTRDGQGDRQQRYQAITGALNTLSEELHPLFVPFDYIEEGILVSGKHYPLVKMEWAEGTPLGNWVEANIDKPRTLRYLAEALSHAQEDLQKANIAHGDWQHDNILVAKSGRSVQLVDYDGMFVPALVGQRAGELGHPNFQHPMRNQNHFDATLDTFACNSILVSLQALALEPALIEVCDNSLLFKKADYESPEQSEMFKQVAKLAKNDRALEEDFAKLWVLCRKKTTVSSKASTKKAEAATGSKLWYAGGGVDTAPSSASPPIPSSPVQAMPQSRLSVLVRPPIVSVVQASPVAPSSSLNIFARLNPWRKPALIQAPASITAPSRVALKWYLSQSVLIPAGIFLRGGDKRENEKPQKSIFLSAYRVGRTPVTVGMYQEYCNVTGEAMPIAPSWGWLFDHPMVNVSWDQARAYAIWAGGALPTEAQWEKAARGTDGREYPWKGAWDASKCVNSSNNKGQTAPIGLYPQGESPYGILDMAGNVWEWCEDLYDEDYYKTAPDTDPRGPGKGAYRIFRGGSWDNNIISDFRCAGRAGVYAARWYDIRGFRLVFPEPN